MAPYSEEIAGRDLWDSKFKKKIGQCKGFLNERLKESRVHPFDWKSISVRLSHNRRRKIKKADESSAGMVRKGKKKRVC